MMNRVLKASMLAVALGLAFEGHARADEPAAAPAAPEPGPRNTGFALGFDLSRFQDDFGGGLLVSTPSFWNDAVRLTLGGGVAWYPYGVSSSGSQEWDLYEHGRLVVEGGKRFRDLPLRLYGFGGVTTLFISQLSTTSVGVGAVGGFGFEVYEPATHGGGEGPGSYFIELGGIGTGLQADKLAGKPIFANGLLIQVGLRIYP
jgi:hypothetical protein